MTTNRERESGKYGNTADGSTPAAKAAWSRGTAGPAGGTEWCAGPSVPEWPGFRTIVLNSC
jgi:hypothetical protein